MENKAFKNIVISTTSNKVNGKFKQEVSTKTAYLTTDDKTAKELEDFGLTKYTSEDKNEDFFILKLVDKFRVYFNDGSSHIRRDLSHVNFEDSDTLNFQTTENVTISINVIKGENMGNTFFRMQAILVDTMDDITHIEPENPFE